MNTETGRRLHFGLRWFGRLLERLVVDLVPAFYSC